MRYHMKLTIILAATLATIYIITSTSFLEKNDIKRNIKQLEQHVQVIKTVFEKDGIPKSMKQPERHVQMIRTVNNIRKYSKTVMVAIINDAYLPLAYSWLCNTKYMGIHNITLFITTDEQSSSKMKRDWPEINVASMNIDDLGGNQSFGRAGYLRVSVKRHQYIYQLLKEGFEMLHFEVDCVWLKNPLPYLQSQQGYDLLVNEVSTTTEYNSGFVYIFNTEKSIQVWKHLAQKMTELARNVTGLKDNTHLPGHLNDQPFYSDIVHYRVPGIKIKVLTLDKFADGKWYQMREADRNALNPYIINNNWIRGNKKKKNRAKKWNHWFLDEHMNCKMDVVRKIVKL